jgi:hypothetical protein
MKKLKILPRQSVMKLKASRGNNFSIEIDVSIKTLKTSVK